MNQVQLSVFYQGGFLSYEITTQEDGLFQFQLKSTPDGVVNMPGQFIVSHKNESWTFEPDLPPDFKKSVLHTLKKAKL